MPDNKLNILMFSGDYDKALAGLILANSAAASGFSATMFFAFWGLLLLRDPNKSTDNRKDFLKKMFGKVTPRGPDELQLSRLNLSGFGKKMLEKMMTAEQAPDLYSFLQQARDRGVQFCCCQLSAEIMGFTKEELLPEVNFMTAEDYLNDALKSDIKLFI